MNTFNKEIELGMVAQSCNPSIWDFQEEGLTMSWRRGMGSMEKWGKQACQSFKHDILKSKNH